MIVRPPRIPFPAGKRFAFTVIDDTDVATVANVRPVYELLESLGMRTTKTVWPMPCPEGSRDFQSSQTLEDPDYARFVVELKRRGFEIASHGATMESSSRERTCRGFERFHALIGEYPPVHANHALNRENLYWGPARLDSRVLKLLVGGLHGTAPDHYQGHIEASAYWWGDLCSRHVRYVRNLTFTELNLMRVNPSMPYRDPSRPLVPLWFSATDAEDVDAFCELITPVRQEKLEREGGISIVATHFGKEFVKDGRVVPVFRERLAMLAARGGWYPTVGELLDWMRQQRQSDALPKREWRRMQWLWARDLALRKARVFSRRRDLILQTWPRLRLGTPATSNNRCG